MRGDIARLGRCTAICTQGEDTIRRSKPFKYAYEKEIVMYVALSSPHYHPYPSPPTPTLLCPLSAYTFDDDDDGRRYAYFKKLDYFSTECIYSPDAYRGHARAFLKVLEAARPSAIIDIIHSGEAFEVKDEVRATQKTQRTWPILSPSPGLPSYDTQLIPQCSTETCKRCGYMSSNDLCKACSLLEGLERGMSTAAIVRHCCVSFGFFVSQTQARRVTRVAVSWKHKGQHQTVSGRYHISTHQLRSRLMYRQHPLDTAGSSFAVTLPHA